MAERAETRIDRALLDMVRRRATEQGRAEEEIIEEALGRYLSAGNGQAQAEESPWPRYPLFDSGDATFADKVEDELTGFGER